MYRPYDVRIGETRRVANPTAYPGEVEGFRPDRVIEVQSRLKWGAI